MSNAISVSHGEFGRAAIYELDNTIITHAHREGHLIFYIRGADARMEVGNEVAHVSHSFGAAVSPWEPHSFHLPAGQRQLCLVLYIKPLWFLQNCASSEFALKFGSPLLAMTPEITDFVRRLTALLLDNEDHDQFDELLFGLAKASFDQSWERSHTECRKDIFLRYNDFRVRRAVRIIQDYVGETMEMEELARLVGLSRPHFFKLFKQNIGVTPNVYINTLRSERAIDFLLTGKKTITDIAFDLGFSSQASFTRFFSSNVGIAPSDYRRVAHVNRTSFPIM
ncbi:AraC family transcriptional regulator [Rhizobium sp. P28RR-XV]|uniref:helix-turn-helix domain-containing protein n=1 Tax=Rhizobium sp. P28RR-XV TaxID=2726737 RepID=UPI00145725BC|nr:AraC family transcriptional regulator [Rhizobium sp. P28RR-XV]NLR88419.1 helix-turn-helix transcriptional regulator [Rhizobium sp. P28RR-XV]